MDLSSQSVTKNTGAVSYERFNAYLDQLVHPEIHLFQRSWSAFHFYGSLGIILGVGLALFLAWRLHLSLAVLSGLILAALLILPGLTMLTKIITGEERIINYHHQIAVVVTVTGLL